jgi:hypothetical protein
MIVVTPFAVYCVVCAFSAVLAGIRTLTVTAIVINPFLQEGKQHLDKHRGANAPGYGPRAGDNQGTMET